MPSRSRCKFFVICRRCNEDVEVPVEAGNDCMRWRSSNRESVCVESEVSFASDMVGGDRRANDVGVRAVVLIMAPILAVLLCDTPAPPVLKEDGDYHKIFDTWLRSVSPLVDFTLDAFDVVNRMEYPQDAGKYDGILLTGSGQSKYPPPSRPSDTTPYRSLLCIRRR